MSTAPQPSLEGFVVAQAARIADACTACGRCVEVCPVVPFAGLEGAAPKAVIGGVVKVLRGEAGLEGDSAVFAHQCNGCGRCIPECPEGINPRKMLMLANTLDAREGSATPQLFRKMARGIRLMAAMQLLPDDLNRLLRPPPPRDVAVIFYLGCNAVRTPNVLFNTMYVLDALEVDYEVLGGPASCCGVIHAKWEGQIATGGRVSNGTLDTFSSFRPEKVVNWCPTCQIHLTETLSSYRDVGFDFDHVTKFLVEQGPALTRRFTTPVDMRVLLHVHEGMAEVGRNVARLLGAVPGLTILGTAEEAGYTCGGSGADRSPGLKAMLREETVRRAREPGVDALVTLYHGCHAQLAAAGRQQGFAALNFTDILVRALGGTPHEDVLETLGLLGDWHEVVRQATPHLQANGIDFDPAQLAEILPDVFTLAEFRGGLQVFAEPD